MLLSSVDVFLGFFTTIETEGLSALFFFQTPQLPQLPGYCFKSVCQPVRQYFVAITNQLFEFDLEIVMDDG